MADNKVVPVSSNGKAPALTQSVSVQPNPFAPVGNGTAPNVRIAVTADPTKQYVPTGTNGYFPYLKTQPPYIDDVSQQFGLQVYDRMMTDSVVHSAVRLFTLGMLSNGWTLKPALKDTEPDYNVAVKVRDWVAENLKALETPYDVVLEQQLHALENGCSVSEQSYKVDNGQLRLRDIREKPLTNSLFIADSYNNTVGIMTQRFPGQIYPAGSYIPISFNLSEHNAQQDPHNAKGELDLSARIPGFLPRALFSVLTNEMRYNDERGRSVLRAAYSPWWLKQQVLAEYLKFLSRFASPSLVGVAAQNATPQNILDADLNPVLDAAGNPIVKSPEQVLAEALAQFENGTAIAVPFGASVTALTAAGDGAAFGTALNYCNREIVIAITQQYLATMEGEHQSRASSETHQDIVSLGILRRKRWLAAQQEREVYLRLLMYNFDVSGKFVARYVPKLSLGMGDGFPMTAADIAALTTSGYLDPSQYEGTDEKLGLDPRTVIMVNGAPMTPTQINARNDAQQEQSQQGQYGGDLGGDNTMKSSRTKAATIPGYVVPTIEVNVPEQPAPIVNVQVDVPQQPAPIVNVQVPQASQQPAPRVFIKVPQQPAPQVHIAPAEAPIVMPMLPDVPMQDVPAQISPARNFRYKINRDEHGLIISVDKEYI